MNEFILKSYELLTVLLPAGAVLFLLRKAYASKRLSLPPGHFLWLVLFAAYIGAIFYLTGAGTVYHISLYGLEIRSAQVNLLPFSREVDFAAYLQNILLFLPLGMLLPLIWPSLRRLSFTVLSGFSLSLLIEASQLLNNRRTDVDDLILNTLGALLGYCLFLLLRPALRRIKYQSSGLFKSEPFLYTGALFLGHFLLFNEFGLARLLYHF